MCAGITMYAPIARHCKPGQNVAVIGIGGLGHLAVAMAHKLGCHVTAFSSTRDKDELIKKLGAERVVDSTDVKAMVAEAQKYHVVLVTAVISNSDDFTRLTDLCRTEGTLVEVALPPEGGKISLSVFPFVMRQINIVGSIVGSRKECKDTLNYCALHDINPLVEEFSFEDFPKAVHRIEKEKPLFRCVVNCVDYAKKHNLHK